MLGSLVKLALRAIPNELVQLLQQVVDVEALSKVFMCLSITKVS